LCIEPPCTAAILAAGIRGVEPPDKEEDSFQMARCPDKNWQSHLLFAVKNERIYLEILKAFFQKTAMPGVASIVHQNNS